MPGQPRPESRTALRPPPRPCPPSGDARHVRQLICDSPERGLRLVRAFQAEAVTLGIRQIRPFAALPRGWVDRGGQLVSYPVRLWLCAFPRVYTPQLLCVCNGETRQHVVDRSLGPTWARIGRHRLRFVCRFFLACGWAILPSTAAFRPYYLRPYLLKEGCCYTAGYAEQNSC